jgi:hypothetical protein
LLQYDISFAQYKKAVVYLAFTSLQGMKSCKQIQYFKAIAAVFA